MSISSTPKIPNPQVAKPKDPNIQREDSTQSTEPPSIETQRSKHPENGLTEIPPVSRPGSTQPWTLERAQAHARGRSTLGTCRACNSEFLP